MNPEVSRFYIKITGPEGWNHQFGESLPIQYYGSLFDNAPLMRNRPGVGKRARPRDRYNIEALAGYILPNTAYYYENNPEGPGIYAVAVVMPSAARKVRSLIGTPFGLDFSADVGEKRVISVDLVVDNPQVKILSEGTCPK